MNIVFTGISASVFPPPTLGPLYEANHCLCPDEQACPDVIISDAEMPFMNGLDFIEEQIEKR